MHKTSQWKGSNSLRFEYGKEYVVSKPPVGLWSKKHQHEQRRSSQRSGVSAETVELRIELKTLRLDFLRAYEAALDRWNAGERDVVFPAGTVRMRLRHKVKTEPIPALLRAA